MAETKIKNQAVDTTIVTTTDTQTLTDKTIAGGDNTISGITPGMWTNPYCFRAWDSGGTTLTDGAFIKINFATEIYDYNNNFTASAYTAPVAGVYHFDGAVSIDGAISTGIDVIISIYVDGSEKIRGGRASLINDSAMGISADILLAANEVVTLIFRQNSAGDEATKANVNQTWFSGHLVHAT